jgi:hypothetical protein
MQGSNSQHGIRASSLPVPLALGVALLLGVLSLVKTKRPIYYTVEEGDNLCTIGECFGQDYRTVYDKNRNVISNPNIIYPGDRCASAQELGSVLHGATSPQRSQVCAAGSASHKHERLHRTQKHALGRETFKKCCCALVKIGSADSL